MQGLLTLAYGEIIEAPTLAQTPKIRFHKMPRQPTLHTVFYWKSRIGEYSLTNPRPQGPFTLSTFLHAE